MLSYEEGIQNFRTAQPLGAPSEYTAAKITVTE